MTVTRYRNFSPILELLRSFEGAVSNTLIKVLGKCVTQTARLQTVKEAASLRLIFARNKARKERQQIEAKNKELAEVRLTSEDYQKQIQLLTESIFKLEKRL